MMKSRFNGMNHDCELDRHAGADRAANLLLFSLGAVRLGEAGQAEVDTYSDPTPLQTVTSFIRRMTEGGEPTALVDVGWILWILFARQSEYLGAPFRRAILWLPTQEGRFAIVPPALRIVGCAINHGVAETRGFEPAHAKRDEITSAQPRRQHACGLGFLRQ